MIQIMGEMYYIDLDKIEEYIDIPSLVSEEMKRMDYDDPTNDELTNDDVISSQGEKRVNLIKFELVKMMLDTILSEDGEMDEKLGNKSTNNLTIPFKLAFNSLLNKKIITHY